MMGQINILLVEDDQDVREVLVRLLEIHGHTVRATSGIVEAMAALDEGAHYDVAVCDYSLPDGDARDLMAQLQQRNIKGICLSGYGPEDLPDLERYGFSRHLSKTAPIEEINAVLVEVANQK